MLVRFREKEIVDIMELLYDKGGTVIRHLVEEGSVGHVEFEKTDGFLQFNLTSNMVKIAQNPLLLIRRLALLLDLRPRFKFASPRIKSGGSVLLVKGQTTGGYLVCLLRRLALLSVKGRFVWRKTGERIHFTYILRGSVLDPYTAGIILFIFDYHAVQCCYWLNFSFAKPMSVKPNFSRLIFDEFDYSRIQDRRANLKLRQEGFWAIKPNAILKYPYWGRAEDVYYYYELYLNHVSDFLNTLLANKTREKRALKTDRYSVCEYLTGRGFCRVFPIPFGKTPNRFKISNKNLYLDGAFNGLTLERETPDNFYYIYQEPESYPGQVLTLRLGARFTKRRRDHWVERIAFLKSELGLLSVELYGQMQTLLARTSYSVHSNHLVATIPLDATLSFAPIDIGKPLLYEDFNTCAPKDIRGCFFLYSYGKKGKFNYTLRRILRER